jgi:hypothetical protein
LFIGGLAQRPAIFIYFTFEITKLNTKLLNIIKENDKKYFLKTHNRPLWHRAENLILARSKWRVKRVGSEGSARFATPNSG